MYISLNWIKNYIKIPKNLTPQELDDKLTLHTVEIEGHEIESEGLDGVVIGEILKIEQHPDADKLSLAKVDVGKDKPLDIVFGNKIEMKVGNRVPVAVAPTVLPGGFEIKKSKVRGAVSEGMLCLDQELGFLEEGISIQYFPHMQPGTSLIQAMQLDDIVYEVDNKSMTHRPDLWGHYGLARDMAGFLKVDFKGEDLPQIESTNEKTLKASIEQKEACNRYMLLEMEGIEVKESPEWLKKSLMAVGQRPINNIVDLTNYIMRDLAQPMHAFDADLAETDEIVVRFAKEGEALKTLDGKDRHLSENMVLITSPKEVLMLGGVMGGESTEVNEKTTRILLESANFDPTITRKTGTKLGLRTDACIMYEKTLDPENCEHALKKFVKLLKEMCPKAKVVSNVIDIYNKKYSEEPINFSLDFLNQRAGKEFSEKEVVDTLTRLGFELNGDAKGWKVAVPHWRATKDVSIPDDLVEEVCRIHGYDNIEPVLPKFPILPAPYDLRRTLKRKTQELFLGMGYHQALNYAFVGENEVSFLGEAKESYATLENALHSDNYLRRSLIPELSRTISVNQNHQDKLRFFEIGRVFKPEEEGEFLDNKKKEKLPKQDLMLAGALLEKEDEAPFYNVKASVASFLNALSLDWKLNYDKTEKIYLHPLRYAGVLVFGEEVGYIAELNPLSAKEMDINSRVGVFELNFEKIVELYNGVNQFETPSKFPSVKIDLALVVDKKVQWASIERIVKGNSTYEVSLEVFDIYEGNKIEEGKKSIAIHLGFQANDKTLTMDEVETEKQKILDALGKTLGAELRA